MLKKIFQGKWSLRFLFKSNKASLLVSNNGTAYKVRSTYAYMITWKVEKLRYSNTISNTLFFNLKVMKLIS